MRLALEQINAQLGREAHDKRVHVLLSNSFAGKNTAYFSHHQKCVIVDRRIAYVGGIDLAYGRYDDATYDLRADAEGRSVLNRYNPCVTWVGQVQASEVTDPDHLSGVELPAVRAITSARIHNGGVQQAYDENLPVNAPALERNPKRWATLDARIQPRMPWQDVHCRIEGPAVSDLVRNFVLRWNIHGTPLLPPPAPAESWPRAGNARIQVLRSAPANMRTAENTAAYKTYSRGIGASARPGPEKADYAGLRRPPDPAKRIEGIQSIAEDRRHAATPQRTDNGIHQAMLRLIDNAAHFIYIESQFFVSAFGAEAETRDRRLSPAARFINAHGPDGKATDQNATARTIGILDEDSHLRLVRNGRFNPGLDREDLITPPTNEVCQALIAGELLIAGPVSTAQTGTLLQLAKQAQVRAKDSMRASAQEAGRPSPYRPLNVGRHSGYASRGAESFAATLRLGNIFVEWRLTFRPEHEDFASHSYETLITGLRKRPTFDVPHEPGVCLPYAFIRDDGTSPRSVGMTYRLKDHPDVTVWLEDANASPDGPHVRSETLTPEYRANFFWTQDYKIAKRVATEWHPGIRHTRIDGRKAVETFVRLVRYDDVEDYGYLAVVRGDPEAAIDTPDLMLYVIRDAANATKRGMAPIGKEEFIKLARTIAASVKRRPVK